MQVIFEKKLRICVDMLYFSVQPATGTTLYRKEEIRGAERISHLAGENGIACYAHSHNADDGGIPPIHFI